MSVMETCVMGAYFVLQQTTITMQFVHKTIMDLFKNKGVECKNECDLVAKKGDNLRDFLFVQINLGNVAGAETGTNPQLYLPDPFPSYVN